MILAFDIVLNITQINSSQHNMEVCGQLHALDTLPLRTVHYDAHWIRRSVVPGPAWMR